MSNEQTDWSSWILGVIATLGLTIAAMGKWIADFYVTRIAKLEKQLADYIAFADNRAQQLVDHNYECIEKHHQAEIRIAQLEAVNSLAKNNSTSNQHNTL